MTLDGGAPIALTSLDFSESNGSAEGGGVAGKAHFSPVTVTTAAGAEAIVTLFRVGLTNQRFNLVVATYKNAQGQAQFEVDFKMVGLTSITLPTVDKLTTPVGDMTWILSASSVQIKTPSASTPASASKQLQQWRGSMTRPTAAPSGKFGFTLIGVDTSGVLSISPLVLTVPRDVASGVSTGRAVFSPLNLTVDATKAGDFTTWLATGRSVSSGVLTYNRRTDAGRLESIELDLTSLFIKSCTFAGNAGSVPVFNVQLNYGGLAVKTVAAPSILQSNLKKTS